MGRGEVGMNQLIGAGSFKQRNVQVVCSVGGVGERLASSAWRGREIP